MYSFISGIFSLRLTCRQIASKLDHFFQRSFETLSIDINFDGLTRAIQLAEVARIAERVRCVRLRFTLVVPGEDELLEKMNDEDNEWAFDFYYPELDKRRTAAVERAQLFMSSFGAIQLSRAFSCFTNLRKLLLSPEETASESPEPMKPILDMLTCLAVFACNIGNIRLLSFMRAC